MKTGATMEECERGFQSLAAALADPRLAESFRMLEFAMLRGASAFRRLREAIGPDLPFLFKYFPSWLEI